MDEDWCCEKLNNLRIKENRLTTLNEIRGQLNGAPNLETLITNRLLSAPELYDCLDVNEQSTSGENEQLAVATDILSICLANLTISGTSDNETPRVLQRALTHKRSNVRALALNTILKELKQQQPSSSANDKKLSDDLLNHVIEALKQPETECGVPAVGILTIVLDNRLNESAIREQLIKLLKENEIIKCRVYELAVNLAKISPANLRSAEFLLDAALSEMDNDDVLLQVSVLEILVSLAEQNHGLLYLERRLVLEIINNRIKLLDQQPLDSLLVPGIIKFFGKIAATQPQTIITGYPHMIQCLFESIQKGDTTVLPAALDSLANLAYTQQGKILLEQQYADALNEIFELFTQYLRNQPTDMKNRVFNTLEIIFTVEDTRSVDIDTILQKWLKQMTGTGDNLQLLIEFCRNPFPDIKVACLRLVKALCRFSWGINALKNTAGFVEYLLDRKVEFDKDVKYTKFEIVQMLANSSMFDMHTTMQMNVYVNDGPYFVASQMDVATESN